MMPTLTDNACDLDVIEALDFNIELPCEHSQHHLGKWGHGGPAYYLIRALSPCGCEGSTELLICKGAYEDATPITCFICFDVQPKEKCWIILSKVGR
jgi:hypothetical protein